MKAPLLLAQENESTIKFFEHLKTLFSPSENKHIDHLLQYAKKEGYNEKKLLDFWLFELAELSPETAYEVWTHDILTCPLYKNNDQELLAEKLLEQFCFSSPLVAIKAIGIISQKNLLPIEKQLEYLHKIVKKPKLISSPETYLNLEQLLRKLEAKSDKKNIDKVRLLLKSLSENLKSEKSKQVDLSNLEVKKEVSSQVPATENEQKMLALEKLAQTDYTAAINFLNHFDVPFSADYIDRALKVFKKISANCVESDNLSLIIQMFKMPKVQNVYVGKEEHFFSLAFAILESCDHKKVHHKDKLSMFFLESMLNLSTKSLKIHSEDLCKFVNLLDKLLHHPAYSNVSLPETFMKAFFQKDQRQMVSGIFVSFYNELKRNGRYLDACRLYDIALQLDPGAKISEEITQDVLMMLQKLAAQENKSIYSLVERFIKFNNKFPGSEDAQVDLLFFLTSQTSSNEIILHHFKRITDIKPIHAKPDILRALQPFKKMVNDKEYHDALQVLKGIKGKLKASQSTQEAIFYKEFLVRLRKKSENDALFCEALALCPFEWEEAADKERVEKWTNSILEETHNKKSLLKGPHLLALFSLLESMDHVPPETLCACYESCKDHLNNELAERMWGYFVKKYSIDPSKKEDKAHAPFSKIFLSSLEGLKYHDPVKLLILYRTKIFY